MSRPSSLIAPADHMGAPALIASAVFALIGAAAATGDVENYFTGRTHKFVRAAAEATLRAAGETP